MQSEYTVVSPEEYQVSKPLSQGVKTWRTINGIMSGFFLLAAFVNMNDSDWYIWVPIYTVPGLLSLVCCIKPDAPGTVFWSFSSIIFLAFCVVYAVYIIITAAEMKGSPNPLQVEEGREFGGLLIIIAWLGISRFTNIGRPGSIVTNNALRNALLFMVCLLAITPVLLWSMCLHDSGKGFGHCQGMFGTSHKKLEF